MNWKAKAAQAGWIAGDAIVTNPVQRYAMLGAIVPKTQERLELVETEKARTKLIHQYRRSKSWKESGESAGIVDNREYCTSLKNQGNCGACVAFGTIAAAETTYQLQANNSGSGIDLSEADLFFCGGRGEASCDNGWYPHLALRALESGVVEEERFPYEDSDIACPLNGKKKAAKISGWKRLTRISQMQEHLRKGALVGVFAVHEDFFSYHGGVYRHVAGELYAYHCVAIVGFNDDEGYWICKNSWGSRWGEGGYFRIAYGECEIDAECWAIDSVSYNGDNPAERFNRRQAKAKMSQRSTSNGTLTLERIDELAIEAYAKSSKKTKMPRWKRQTRASLVAWGGFWTTATLLGFSAPLWFVLGSLPVTIIALWGKRKLRGVNQ